MKEVESGHHHDVGSMEERLAELQQQLDEVVPFIMCSFQVDQTLSLSRLTRRGMSYSAACPLRGRLSTPYKQSWRPPVWH